MVDITSVLNDLDQMGVFSYVLPFLLIFAVVFALLKKSGILSKILEKGENGAPNKTEENNAILAIIAGAIALLALQYDIVSIFFENIFPKFGIGVSIILVLLILGAFMFPEFQTQDNKHTKWIGFVIGGIIVVWALINWNEWFGYGGPSSWIVTGEIWTYVVLGIVGLLIYWIVKK